MRSLLAATTTRGTSFLAAGTAAALIGLVLGEQILLSVGLLLLALPLLALLGARRAHYRLSCVRTITPQRVPAGRAATVTLRLENISRIPTSLLLAEDSVPYVLGARPRYVLNGIERSGERELSYQLRSDLRGKFEIGPLQIRMVDAFGLVELGRSFAARSTLTVTPRVVSLDGTAARGNWVGDGDGSPRTTASAGEDDVIPRAYRDGDELRRVHWRSTARYGELMVRREEQRWTDRLLIFLDTRRAAHAGEGLGSSFEYAVSAVASIGVHLARLGLGGDLVTDTGPLGGGAPSRLEDVVLDSLAMIKQSNRRDLGPGLAKLRASDGGVLVAVLGKLTSEEARQLAASRQQSCAGVAIMLATASWSGRDGKGTRGADGPQASRSGADNKTASADTGPTTEEPTAAILRTAGWRVTTVDADTPLAAAWRRFTAVNGTRWHPAGTAAEEPTAPEAPTAATPTAATPTAATPTGAGR